MSTSILKPIVILTGAGISAESGIKTFRDHNGLWENHRIEDVATPEAYFRNPKLVHEFYNQRRKQLQDQNITPNAAHLALAKLEKEWPGDFLLVTQNVDNLHERAGSKNIIHMHGELQKIFCTACDDKSIWLEELSVEHSCQRCRSKGTLRPDIVWFGEMPYKIDEIMEAVSRCSLFLSIGTSGKVYPAAGFVQYSFQAKKIEVNLNQSDISDSFHVHRIGPASVQVPQLVEEILNGQII